MPLIEVERKRALDAATHAYVLDRLSAIGYHIASEHTETDDYYSRPDVDFMTTVECLRVRRRDGFAEITYKPSSTSVTTNAAGMIAKQETNVALRDHDQADAANDLLTMLDMRHVARVDKHRREYRCGDQPDTTVAVDTVHGAGTFVEVEALRLDTADGEAVLNLLERQLDITGFPVVVLPYRDLVLQADPAEQHSRP